MTLVEIEDKIKEIGIKLYGEKPQYAKISNGKFKFIASVHLRKFLLEELKKLESLKTNITNLKVYELEVEWNNVFFKNKEIKVKYGNVYTDEYYFELSRSSFEILKPFILFQKLKPLKVKIYGNKIISISNLSEILNIFEILTLKSEIYIYFNQENSKSFNKITSQIHKLENKDIIDFYRIIEHSDYLEYLCQTQSADYKIIPATELVVSNQQIVSEDDAFLFTINKKTKTYIIWESILINKATYIFETNKTNYLEDLHFIFDFIVSDNDKKRFKLGALIKDKENKFNLVYKLRHSTKEEWINKIEGIGC